jgi:nanoRNase/pAp phosphatase (c-di-AMP/oligoRNAs hydrolase)
MQTQVRRFLLFCHHHADGDAFSFASAYALHWLSFWGARHFITSLQI